MGSLCCCTYGYAVLLGGDRRIVVVIQRSHTVGGYLRIAICQRVRGVRWLCSKVSNDRERPDVST